MLSCRRMRRLTLMGTFIALVGAVFVLWQFRFERIPGIPTCSLADLSSQTDQPTGVQWLGPESKKFIALRIVQSGIPVVARFTIPNMPAVDWLLIQSSTTATALKCGKQNWDDGRSIVEWHRSEKQQPQEIDEYSSVRDDQIDELSENVVGPEGGKSIPVLRLENRGASGQMEVRFLEISALQERLVWKIGRWPLMMAWVAWVIVWIGPVGKFKWIRPLLAGVGCLLMGIYFVLPGPWKLQHALGGDFQVGPKSQMTSPTKNLVPPLNPSAVSQFSSLDWQSVGKVPPRGDLTLKIKAYAAKARPLLHSLLLFGPTLLIICLVGRRRAILLMTAMALSIEAAQFFFGYGFDKVDIYDLFNDAVGIALAVVAHRYLVRMIPLNIRNLVDPLSEVSTT